MLSSYMLLENWNISRHSWKSYPCSSPVSDLPALCGEDIHCYQQRIPIKAHPQWRGNTFFFTPYVSCVAVYDIGCLFTLCSGMCVSPAVTRGHSLTVHWLAWPRHSRGPTTILKWASPSADPPSSDTSPICSVTYASLLYSMRTPWDYHCVSGL